MRRALMFAVFDGFAEVYQRAPDFPGYTDTLTSYDVKDGTQLWSKPAFSVGTIAASRGTLFYNEYPNVVALDETTGAQLWATPVVGGATTGAPAVANGRVFVTHANLIALNAATGAVVWTAPASSTLGSVGRERRRLCIITQRRVGCIRRAQRITVVVGHGRQRMWRYLRQRGSGGRKRSTLSRRAGSIPARVRRQSLRASNAQCRNALVAKFTAI
jgi:hypothetical protein